MTVLDRFEGGYAVLETENGTVIVLRSSLPEEVREGDVLTERNGHFAVDTSTTSQRRSSHARRLRRLTGKDKRGKQ
ncbi:DUF3006 domain-containing protein [Ruminococcus sp.]|uniref:DUF3006 domain-containing protein n=1 Tax=Ruminococcus sp. TaxID=41978 RepID=UPI0025FDF45E|nr:DUF3006 domain-containing protein [Ruminococcus sp.]MBR1431586.1 DUF3006 domain-containing protein [Ruminococcus sp.]